METGLGGALSASYLLQNLKAFASLPPFLINAGTLLSFFLLPAVHPKVSALKMMAVLFALGNFLFGTVLEFRIWFELIPFALFAIESHRLPRANGGQAGNVGSSSVICGTAAPDGRRCDSQAAAAMGRPSLKQRT